MKRATLHSVLALMVLLLKSDASASALETAQSALSDKLYSLAQKHATVAMTDEPEHAMAAQLVILEALAGQSRYDDMLAMLKQWNYPEADAFLFWHVWALYHTYRYAEADTRAATHTPGTVPSVAFLRLRARVKLALNDTSSAWQIFEAAARAATNDPATRAAILVEWSAALAERGQADEALTILAQLDALQQPGAAYDEGRLLHARLLAEKGRTHEANVLYEKLATNTNTVERAYVQAALALSSFTWHAGETNNAVAFARAAVARATLPDMRRAAGFWLGDLLAGGTADAEEGVALIKALVREYPESQEAMQAQLKLGDTLLVRGFPERAAMEYRVFLETYPSSRQDARVLQGRGWALMQLKRFTEAGNMFQRAAELSDDATQRAECLFKYADAVMADGRFVEAADAYARVAREYPDSSRRVAALFQEADCRERAADYTRAAEGFQSVSSVTNDVAWSSRALLRLADVYVRMERLDQALDAYDATLTRFSNIPDIRVDALFGRGRVYYRSYRFADAMRDFGRVATLDAARMDEMRFLMTLCLYGMGRDADARTEAERFLNERPDSSRTPDMILWLAKFNFNHGAPAKAQTMFIDYATRWPQASYADAALIWAARAATEQSDFTKTIEIISRFVTAYPESERMAEALVVQADALMELARFDEAVLLLDRVIILAGDSEFGRVAALRKADCLFAMGADNTARYTEALEGYRLVLTKENLSPSIILTVNFKIARSLEKLNRIDDAIDHYYTHVLLYYHTARSQGKWFDEAARTFFARAAFNMAEYYEQSGKIDQAVNVLRHVANSDAPAADEARQRMRRLRNKRSIL